VKVQNKSVKPLRERYTDPWNPAFRSELLACWPGKNDDRADVCAADIAFHLRK